MPTTRPRTAAAAIVLVLASALPSLAQDTTPKAPAREGEARKPKTVPGGPPPNNPGQVPGTIGEVFRAPEAEEWEKPCLLTWQRTWEDALALQKQTGKPILICVNMDGEPASEHYAGVRYRTPEVAKLYAPYITVIASVYRHTPTDHDEAGRRIPCPRFGGVTCGEHIAIEPVLYEKYFEGQRIAPRHICIEPDGGETYDYFYANDVSSVLVSVKEATKGRDDPLPPVKGDRPLAERVASRDSRDRTAVEQAYDAGDAATQRTLLAAAAAHPEAAPLDLLRRAVFGLDPENARLARTALAKSAAPEAAGLMADALKAPMEAAEREALVAALAKLGEKNPRAKWISVVHRGLGTKSSVVDSKAWADAAGGTYSAPGAAAPAAGGPKEPGTPAAPAVHPDVELAESTLAAALDGRRALDGPPRLGRREQAMLLEEARAAALRAEGAGAAGWRTKSVIALASYYSDNLSRAYEESEAAVKEIPPGEGSFNSMAVVTVFAEGRWKALKAAVIAKKEWPPSWLADLHAAYSILLRHPRATDAQIAWHYELLVWLNVQDRAGQVLREGLARFHDSDLLHGKLRDRAIQEGGPKRLEAVYEDLIRADPESPTLLRQGARASVVAGDMLRRARQAPRADEAYGRALALFDRARTADPGRRAELDVEAAVVLAGRARMAFQAGDDERALAALLDGFERSAAAASEKDGLGFSPAETGTLLLARLKANGKGDAAAKLEAALKKFDPALLPADR